MGSQLSGLAQFVASLEGHRDDPEGLTEVAGPLPPRHRDAEPPPPAVVQTYAEAIHALASARQRLEALAGRVAELRRRVAGGAASGRMRPVG